MVEPQAVNGVEPFRVNLLANGLAGPGLDRRAACGPGVGPLTGVICTTPLRRSGTGQGAGDGAAAISWEVALQMAWDIIGDVSGASEISKRS